MKLTVLFWNVWLNNHLESEIRRKAVWKRLRELLDEHSPDVIGLNEVVTDHEKHEAPIVAILRENGYHVHYEPLIPLDDGRFMGNALASKHPVSNYIIKDLGYNVIARRHGQPNVGVPYQLAKISPKDGSPFTFGVIHTLALYLYALPAHYRQQIPLAKTFLDKKLDKPAIFGGDFNEFKYMPFSFYSKVRKKYRRKTGTYLSPTWTAYANNWHPVRANYDHVYWTRDTEKLSLDSFQVSHRHPSDHAPIIAIFDLQ